MIQPTADSIAFSLMDRLVSPPGEIRVGGREVPDREYLRDSIRRDIEALLNMRQRCLSVPAHLAEVQNSLLTFGIPDFSGANLSSEDQQEAFRLAVEAAIERHEPRVHFVEVRLIKQTEQLERTLRFQIDVYVRDEEEQPKLSFKSTLDPLTHNVALAQGQVDG